jgi:hypothetical protein
MIVLANKMIKVPRPRIVVGGLIAGLASPRRPLILNPFSTFPVPLLACACALPSLPFRGEARTSETAASLSRKGQEIGKISRNHTPPLLVDKAL